ncbi:MAG TPA: SusF/SusE family outer membrane protein, partial [Flavisolibacter sp.]|nr:SusF/SusE family outer membrane protein [Flavisolibacter sp.]
MLVNFSCKKSYDAELNKGDTRLILSVSKDSMSLKQVNETADAFVFNWTSGSNKGTNSSIAYTLKIDKKGNNFKNPQIEQLDKGVLTKKYTVKDFNALLLNKWNSSPDTAVNLEAKIIASVSDKTVAADSSNIISFTAKPYAPVTGNLYLIGDATPNGWDANSATPLSAIIGQPGKFSWQGNLKSGHLKFITTLTQFLPSYNKGSSNTSLFYRTDNAQPDDKFNISIPGNYVVTVDLLNLTINIATGNLPPYTQLWIVGSATPNGWDINNPNKMIVDSSNLFVFNYNEILAAGEFKMPTSTGN